MDNQNIGIGINQIKSGVKMVSQTDGAAVFRGYAVVYGYVDIDGDYFTKSTNFRTDTLPGADGTIDHTFSTFIRDDAGVKYVLGAVEVPVGKVVSFIEDDFGLSVDVEVLKSNPYFDFISQMVEGDRMGFSSGTNHTYRKQRTYTKNRDTEDAVFVDPETDYDRWVELQIAKSDKYQMIVERDLSFGELGPSDAPTVSQTKTSSVEYWPITEVAFTVHPNEFRTINTVDRVKSADLTDDAPEREIIENVGVITPKVIDGELLKSSTIHEDIGKPDEPTQESKELILKTETSQQSVEDEPEAQTKAVGQSDADTETEIELEKDETDMSEVTQVETAPQFDQAALVTEMTKAMSGVIDTKIETAVQSAVKSVFENEPVGDGGISGIGTVPEEGYQVKSFNFNNKTKRGDDEVKATAHFFRTGDAGAIESINSQVKAVDGIGNIAVGADGLNAVPVGHHNQIIEKRSPKLLDAKLGIQKIPGNEWTVNVPTEDGTLQGFAAAAEQNAARSNTVARDKPVLGTVPMTLARKSVDVELTQELLMAEDVALMTYVANKVARDEARIRNQMLVDAVLSASMKGVDATGSTSLAPDEIIELMYSIEDEYAEDGETAFLTRRKTEGLIRSMRGEGFLYASTPMGESRSNRNIDGYGLFNDRSMPQIASGEKSVAFGDFSYVGCREAAPTYQRNPFKYRGLVVLEYDIYCVYRLLQSEAIVHILHP